ncbi:hypothetical protein RJ640_028342 [Escallonia rubra]|uniref:DNA mismatch repair proteins mutS family domain-containing protein n=1 Tax=Escallonia rubra TaxID=112253 RepID=A0AA88QL76_9ASTE|nr:hypothetical protein RJ640_028342 [Escallonia rubra]
MLSLALFGNSCTAIATVAFTTTRPSKRFTTQAFLNKPPPPLPNSTSHPSVVLDSLRVLEWDKVCDSVASFAGTSLGQDATKAQLWSLGQSYTESLRLLEETNAAVEMHKYGGCTMDFAGIDVASVKSAVQHARRGLPMDGNEAMALVALLQFAESLQLNLKAAIKEDADWLQHFMPLSEMIMELVINRSLVKFIQQLIDEDGSVRDSACLRLLDSTIPLTSINGEDIKIENGKGKSLTFVLCFASLMDSRQLVVIYIALLLAINCLLIIMRVTFTQLFQLMESLVKNEMTETSSLEVSHVDGRWCVKSGADQQTSFEGLLLSSGSGAGSIVEPLSAVPLNDELQQARASVANAEADFRVERVEGRWEEEAATAGEQWKRRQQKEENDAKGGGTAMGAAGKVLPRHSYSLPPSNRRKVVTGVGVVAGGWCMQMDLDDVQNLLDNMIRLDVINARATYSLSFGGTCPDLFLPEDKDSCLTAEASSGNKSSYASHPTLRKWTLYLPKANHPLLLQKHRQNLQKVVKDVTNATALAKLEQAPPVPVDIFVAQKTRVLVITGPNTGGKTICLKTVGLAAMMAKSGLYVLSAEPVRIPWFDSVFADIGDEQSLSQSLSTFSGHLKQTSDIQSHSTSLSLVLLDEVGAGTNPLEGAALGMSLLESFAESGALLTISTTHHGELKTLKYSHDAFENACMEFDEVNLKPTYRILWGVPGRSNAINIAERLGLPDIVISKARELYGPASAEINEVIVDMERFKQNFHEHIREAQDYLKLSRDRHRILLVTRRKVTEHGSNERYRKMQQIFEVAAVARSTLHKQMRQLRANVTQTSRRTTEVNHQYMPALSSQQTTVDKREIPVVTKTANAFDNNGRSPSEKRTKLPKVGEMVHVSSLNKKAMVLKVEPSKEEVVVQAGNMKLKLKLVDLLT